MSLGWVRYPGMRVAIALIVKYWNEYFSIRPRVSSAQTTRYCRPTVLIEWARSGFEGYSCLSDAATPSSIPYIVPSRHSRLEDGASRTRPTSTLNSVN